MAGSDYGVIAYKNNKRFNGEFMFKLNNQLYYFYKFNVFKVEKDNDLDEDLDYANALNCPKYFTKEFKYGSLGLLGDDEYYYADLWAKVDVSEYFGCYAILNRKCEQVFEFYILDGDDVYNILMGYDVGKDYWHSKKVKKECLKFINKYNKDK